MAVVTKDGKAYDSADVKTTINGLPTEVSEVTYETTQEHQLNYGLGKKPSSWSHGKESYSCTVTFAMKDIIPIEKMAAGNLLNIEPFYLNVTYVNDYNEIVNDTILAKFQNQGREVTGDMGLSKQYELFVLNIDFNNL